MPADPTRARDLFLAATEMPPERRASFLAEACGPNAELRGEVELLLAAHAEPAPILEPPAPAAPAPTVSLTCPANDPDRATDPFASTPPAGSAGGDTAGTIIAGRYTLGDVLGEGGMGTVYRALQTEPVRRPVALKLIRTGMDSRAVLARFDAERQALALMDHPNIARVYDGGTTEAGRPFFVMELVSGLPITAFCDARRLTVGARLELFVSVCRAVQHAHQKGIIHRDLKPSNVLVTEVDGRPTPKVIDFGVAKATELKLTDLSIVENGVIVGTPQYMSPEQADPSSPDVDTRTDVYALGVILYELLVGSPPIEAKMFRRGALLEVLRMVREVDPPRPSTKLSTADGLPRIAADRGSEAAQLKRAVRGDLDWIVMKSLEKDRGRRYESANELAADVGRHLAHEPVLAAPPGRGYRLKKFVRKNRGAVIAAGLVVLALLCGIAGTTWGLIRAEGQRADAEEARLAEAARVRERDAALGERDAALGRATKALALESERVEELQYGAGVNEFRLAKAVYDNGDVKLAAERLDKVPPAQRGWEWHHLRQQTRGGIFTLHGHTRELTSVSFSPDGRRIVTGSLDGTVKVWDARTGAPLLDISAYGGWVTSVSISPDGSRIVTGGFGQKAKVFDARTGHLLLDLGDSSVGGYNVSFSPDGARIASARRSGVVLADARTGAILLELKRDGTEVWCVSFSPDGARIATGTATGLIVWDARTGAALLDVPGRGARVNCVAFSPDGARIVAGECDPTSTLQTARVSDARTGGHLLDLRGHKGELRSVSFSPGGTRILTGSADGTAKVWDAKTGVHVRDLLGGHATDEFGVSAAFSPDGAFVVTGGWEDRVGGTAKVWDARTGSALLDLNEHTDNVWCSSFGPGGTRIATGGADGTAKVWDARTGTCLLTLNAHTAAVSRVAFCPTGTRLATADRHGTGKLWDARTGTLLLELRGKIGGEPDLSFNPDGTRLVATGVGGTAVVWDTQTGQPVLELKGGADPLRAVSYSADGRRIAAGGWGGTAVVWDAQTGAAVHKLERHTGWVTSVAFSPDGTRVVTASLDKTAKVWDTRTGVLVHDLVGHTDHVWSASFSPDGTRIVTGSSDKTVKIWDARTGTPLLDLKGHTEEVISASLSPDGARLVACGYFPTPKVWYVRPDRDSGRGLGSEELAYRWLHTRSNFWGYRKEYDSSRISGDGFATRFYLDRILSLPEHRTTERYRERNALQPDPCVVARTGFHHPALAKVPYESGVLHQLAVKGDRLAARLVAQEFLRDGRPRSAVPLLFACLFSRSSASPPVEELLLAQAHLDLKQPDEAKRFYQIAADWLDRPGWPIRAANVVAHSVPNPWAGVVAAAPVGDPSRSPFDWEPWHECDVFRVQVERRLASRP